MGEAITNPLGYECRPCVCVWAMWVPSEEGFGLNLLGYECDSMVCVVGSLRPSERWVPGWDHMYELRLVHHWLVPYVWAVAGPPGCVCHPCVVMVLCVSHELNSPKLKVLYSVKNVWCVVQLVLAWIFGLWIWYGIGFRLDLVLILVLDFVFGFGFEGSFKTSMSL